MDQYPARPRFFAFRFVRILCSAYAANEIGPETCWLLTVIAHAEDARGYRSAVTYFNPDLASVVGCGSVDSLARIRDKAVGSGWLHYVPGAKGRAASYWVQIPPQFCGRNDADERPAEDDILPQNCGTMQEELRENVPQICGTNRGESAEKARRKRGECAEPNTLSLSLSQETQILTGEVSPVTPLVSRAADGHGGPNGSPGGDVPKGLKRLIEVWNGIDGVQPCKLPTRKRVSAWRQRERTSGWIGLVKQALDKVRESDFCRGSNDRGWLANIDWFLRPDTVAGLIEGKYDNREPKKQHGHLETAAELLG